MKTLLHLLAAALLPITAGAINVTEPPDQANTGLGTVYVLSPGQNIISGLVSTPGDGQDRFQVSVPDGMLLSAVSKTTSGSSFDGGFVSFNNQSLNGLGDGSFIGLPLGFGTYPVLISTNLTLGTSWSLTFTVDDPGSVIGVEHFDYSDGPLGANGGANGGTFWDYKNVSPSGRTGVKSTWDDISLGSGIAYVSGGRLVTGGNGWVKREYNGANETEGAINESNAAKTVFARVTVTTGATLPGYFGIASYDFGSERLFLGKRNGGNTFGYEIIGGASISSAVVVPTNATFTLVFRLDFAGNGISLFLNPNLRLPMLDSANIATVVANAFYPNTNWSTALRLASGPGGEPILWDDFIVATTWEALADPVVTTTTDEDNGFLGGGTGVSLREAVKYGVTGPVTFDPSLSGKTITLTHADGDMVIDRAVTIDATALLGGITVDGRDTSRHFDVGSTESLTLRGLTLTRGNGTGAVTDNHFGGAIRNKGTLTLTQCTLAYNTASSSGGAIFNDGPLFMTHCTFAGNRAGDGGGAILNPSSPLTLTHCTLSGNSATNSGGAILTYTPGTVELTNTIIAENAAPSGADITKFSGTIATFGVNLIGNLAGSDLTANVTILTGAPKLSPLGYFGGPVQTMHPLIGSPAIDAAGTIDPGGTDARGFPRFKDGDSASSGSQLDIGAVEAGRLLTVTAAGDGAGFTLRAHMASTSAFGQGTRIGFSTSLFPGTITLASQLTPPAGNALFIDASNLTGPVTISGDNQFRVLNIPTTATVAMHSVKIVGGNAGAGGGTPPPGGGIWNDGTCTVLSSTLSGNVGLGGGGGIFNNGTCLVHSSTLSGNSTNNYGGGIRNDGTCTVLSSTLSGNSGGNGIGGGIGNTGACTVISSTLSGNSANSGGGIGRLGSGTLHLLSSTVAGNTAPTDANIFGPLATNTSNLTSGDPLLAPLGDYGGPTQTMPPRPGSPAIDAATATSAQTDQRGFPRSRDGDGNGTATPDIGAVEASLPGVTNGNDNGPGSLRQALTDAAALPGPDVIFFTASVTPHITLANEILITDPAGVTLDATDRPTGLVIDAGPGTNRHFRIAEGTTAVFNRVRLYGGGGTGGGVPSNYGGSILNGGALTLRECTFSDNTSASAGGAVYNQTGSLSVDRCTFHGNTSGSSGAILHESITPMLITASTFTRNIGRFEGGAITLGGFRAATITHCTIVGNAVTQTGGAGSGGIRAGNPSNAASNLLTLRDSIVAENTDANFPGVPNVNAGFINPAGSVNVTTGNAKVATLGDYGGPTWTMPPMPGSPAIDTATSSTAATDQRGVARLVDGNMDMDDFSDIGAVEMPRPLTVTTTADQNDTPSGPQLSLREAIRDAEAGATILFDSSFNGQTADKITLGSEIAFTKGLIINASANSGGVTIDGGPGANRIFTLPAGTGAYLQRLTLTGGGGGGSGGGLLSGPGGAIYCYEATLSLVDCVLTGNSSPMWGGAITNTYGTLTMDRCLLINNSSANDGGAVNTDTANLTAPATSSATLTNCTLINNTATAPGGGLYNNSGRATLLHCTITGNTGQAGFGSGVANHGNSTKTTVQNCLIAGNANADDVSFIDAPTNSFLSLGGNLIGSGNATAAFNQFRDATAHTAATLRLAPLADYGGPTHTIALRSFSPARDNATTSPITTDQRGFGIAIGTKDSGAYEAGNFFIENFNVFAQEFLPHTATDAQRARTFDFDGDRHTNEAEWLAFTDPGSPSSTFRVSLLQDDGDLKIIFPTITGRTYRLQQSTTMLSNSWTDSGLPAKNGNNALQNFIVRPANGPTRQFFRVTVGQ